MIGTFFAIFIILHGLVHLLYSGQSWRLFELQPAMIWPDGSWVFSKFSPDEPTRLLATIACVMIAAGFATGGIAILFRQSWWQPVVVTVAIFSSLVFILLWNGKMEQLHNQGAIGVLINIALIFAVIILRWAKFEF